jgi:hypothetical protein
MTERDGFEEAVLLFEPDASAVCAEMRISDFDTLVAGTAHLDQFAASVVKAAYVLVGQALAVQGIVFFLFKVDEEGTVDSLFNLPLRYLAENAGAGPDLGTGTIRVACRGKCPVPWHSVNLWDPQGSGEDHPAYLAQKNVWRNRLGLHPAGSMDELLDNVVLEDGRREQRKLESKLTETFGEEGKVSLENLIRQHNEQVARVSDKFRADLAQQQQVYLEQIRSGRDEIQRLKAELRNEQERSRRLQQLLRGDP